MGKGGNKLFEGRYNGKKVVVTGHTGFKGSWMTAWLLKLGAEVVGISREILTEPAMFKELGLEGRICHHFADVRDLSAIREIVAREKPDFVFHLAAQAIVSVSYQDPVGTVSTNVLGAMNLLESLREADWPCVVVLITSDKCYDNVEWVWGYRETDAIGGKDVYSGSKGAAEVIIKSYFHSFFSAKDCPVRLGVGRAGNVIGGGDWSKDRIVADCMRAWSEGRSVEIRSPSATRPWQHVLEPISGYLTLGAGLRTETELSGEAFNFGPRAEQSRTVLELLKDLSYIWGFEQTDDVFRVTGNIPFHEAGLLKLNCDKALFHLGWEPNLSYDEMIQLVGGWHYAFYKGETDMFQMTESQIAHYEKTAADRARVWTV
ncbi:MAG: CDP-glucose 4,6-dehydratase [Verrucomicrobia subdivision 3 bacterium]|nr:CDP-glucose 4,6-dehydratase [Limisphaerales bacterium]MCS1415835.1 CDP-glucose 4,6-dehydratase [Limisphaerales bacterium]